MANRRTTILGVVAGIVVVGGAAALVVTHRQTATTSTPVSTKTPASSQGGNTSPAAGGPTSAPLAAPVKGKIASAFGWQYSGALNEWYYNPGITFAAPKGRPVEAAWAGRVTQVTKEPHMGLTVTINDGDGFETVYGHLGRVEVKAGQAVRQGEVIGTVGAASLYSRNAGSHVDFQVYHGATATNPMNYLHPSS
ncbi:M23 family metallopeptidase [Sulfobacillus harzensis]|uniref:M23 family metallopeptidase n=1 Tax=Sulfobacillus harzensis TaxID=2729629 RepID=A0A7Y0L270_9FIRM|nr:M23 family metallopeptidase [Sulfobacillus harzensis]NMP21000.1 M23 family metallopeptidase [Sulfobacillus harzensis]